LTQLDPRNRPHGFLPLLEIDDDGRELATFTWTGDDEIDAFAGLRDQGASMREKERFSNQGILRD